MGPNYDTDLTNTEHYRTFYYSVPNIIIGNLESEKP